MNYDIKKEINRQLKRVISLTVMGSICVVSAFSVGAFSKKVSITDNGNTVSIVTMNSETDKILEQAGIELGENDAIVRIDDSNNSIDIKINRAFEVNVNVDGQVITTQTAFTTVSELLQDVGVELGAHDGVSPSLETEISEPTDITVERRCGINVTADGRTLEYSVPYVSVEEAINYAQIPLAGQDIVSVDKNTPVSDGLSFSIERIGYRNNVVTQEVAYETVTKNTDKIAEGQTQVAVKGVNGQKEVIIKETLKDGAVVSSEETSSKITVSPVNEVVLVGVKPSNTTVSTPSKKSSGYVNDNKNGTLVDHNGKTISYSSKLSGSCTAYTAPAGARTSTGTPAKYGYVAVNPKIIPYGTKLYIASADGSVVYGYATAADTGGALMKGTALVDLYYDNINQCYSFGRRNMNVYILK